MKILARAPGKLVLLGEYAVLEGGVGLVMAVDRQARVTLEDGSGDGLAVAAPPLEGRPIAARIDGERIIWPDGRRLPLVDAALESFPAGVGWTESLSGRKLTLDTTDFFAAPGVKLGLGSSGALCVALRGALSAAVPGSRPPTLAEVLTAHRRFQQGGGSGIDVAASFHGGVMEFRRPAASEVEIRRLSWPPNLHGCGVFSGRPASTTDRLDRLGSFRKARPDVYRALMSDLKRHAEAGAAAFSAARLDAFLDAAGAFTQILAELGRCAALALETAAHRELAEIGARCGVLYKTSGAGGGDFGLALGASRERVERFATEASGRGRLVLPLSPFAEGLTVSGHGLQDLR